MTLTKVRSLLTYDCCHEIVSEVTIAFESSTILYEYVGHFHISYLKLRLKVPYIKKQLCKFRFLIKIGNCTTYLVKAAKMTVDL